VGGGIGSMSYKMNKNVIPFHGDDWNKENYDEGYGYVIGITVGYKYMINQKLGIEVSAIQS